MWGVIGSSTLCVVVPCPRAAVRLAMCAVADGFRILRDASAVPHAGSGSTTAQLQLQCRPIGLHSALPAARSAKVPLTCRMSTIYRGALCSQPVFMMLLCSVPINLTLKGSVSSSLGLKHLLGGEFWHVHVCSRLHSSMCIGMCSTVVGALFMVSNIDKLQGALNC